MELLDLMLFDIQENCIAIGAGSFYFFEVKPPNFATLDQSDCELYYLQFEGLMRATTEYPFFILALDKTVSLVKNREYIATLDDRFEDFKAVLNDSLTKMEDVSGNTRRGYYYGIFAKKPETAERFSDILAAKGMEFTRPGKQDLATIMRSFNLREFVDSDIFIEDGAKDLVYGRKKTVISPLVSRLLPTAISFDSSTDYVVQTNFCRKAYAVRNLPRRIDQYNGSLLRKMLQRPNTTAMVRISDMSYSQTKELVNRQFSNSKSRGWSKKITEEIEAQGDAANLQEFYRECQERSTEGGAVKVVNIYLETYGKTKDELRENSRKVVAICESYGVTVEDFVLRQKEGFFGVSPIGRDTRGRLLANNIPSNTFGRLYPFSSSSINDVTGVDLGWTVDGGMVNVDFKLRTPTRANSNIAIVGDSGMGKSHLIKKMVSQLRMQRAIIYILDPENECGDMVTSMGGTNINCASGQFTINPLQIRVLRGKEDDGADETIEEREAVPAALNDTQPFFQHLSWLADFIPVLLPQITASQLAALRKLIRDVYKLHGIDEHTDLSGIGAEDYPIFSDVYNYIGEVLDNRETYNFYRMIDDADLKSLLLLLDDVCFGSLSLQFNHQTHINGGDFVNLNIQELLMGSQDNMQAVLFNYLTYIWGQVTTKMGFTVLVVDELYLLANEDNPIILKYLNSFVRRSRKYQAALIMATQKIMDCLNEKIAHWTSAIFDTPTYKFIFYPGDVDLEKVKVKLKLTGGELASICYPERRNCLLKIGKEKYHMKIGTLSYEENLFGKGGGK